MWVLGVDTIDLNALEMEILVGNALGVNTIEVADHAMAISLHLSKATFDCRCVRMFC